MRLPTSLHHCQKSIRSYLVFDAQLHQLEKRGLQVDDTAAAVECLERLGYFPLSGYWYPLRKIDLVSSRAQGSPVRLATFVAGSRLEQVVQLYVFDKKLRMLATDWQERSWYVQPWGTRLTYLLESEFPK